MAQKDDALRVRLPRELGTQAKIAALKAGITLEEWVRRAVEAQLEREGAES